MKNFSKKLEITANVSIILVALLIGVGVAKNILFDVPPPPPSIERKQPDVGAEIDLPGVLWNEDRPTIILALKKGCRFCTESAPFYRQLREISNLKNIRLLAVLQGPIEQSSEYLKELDLDGIEVIKTSLDAIQVSGTPTLIVTNGHGEITNVWLGKLTETEEREVLKLLD
ncbi:MAG: hypothetical protein KIS76_18515 [Pyrinomonadaceae bacterium]|nr:hypothetical protein [Pyrinomonadaceae bacterium]